MRSSFGEMFGGKGSSMSALTTILGWLDDAGIDAPGGPEGPKAKRVRQMIVEAMRAEEAGQINAANRIALEAFKLAHDGWLHW